MATAWANVDSNFPMLDYSTENVGEQMRKLHNYMFALTEELKYTLDNLDMSNMNESAYKDFTESFNRQLTAIGTTAGRAISLCEQLQEKQEEDHDRLMILQSIIDEMTNS